MRFTWWQYAALAFVAAALALLVVRFTTSAFYGPCSTLREGFAGNLHHIGMHVGDDGDYEGDGSATTRPDSDADATERCLAKHGGPDAAAVLDAVRGVPFAPGSAFEASADELRRLLAKVVCVPAAVVAPGGALARTLVSEGDGTLRFEPTHDADAPAEVVARCGVRAWRHKDVERAVGTWGDRAHALLGALPCRDAASAAAAGPAMKRLLDAATARLSAGCIAERGADGDRPPGVRDPGYAPAASLAAFAAPFRVAGDTDADDARFARHISENLPWAPGQLLSSPGTDARGTGDARDPRPPVFNTPMPRS